MLSLVVIVGLFAFGCGDSSDESSNGESSYERPDDTQDFIDDDDLEEFEDNGLSIHDGDSPPDIEATYFFGDFSVTYTDSATYPPSGGDPCHSEKTYTAVSDDEYEESYTSPNCDSEGDGIAHYISGEESCFTLYRKGSSTFEGCEQETVGLLSACLNDDGDMEDPKSGKLRLSNEGEDCDELVAQGSILGEGERAITEQDDGMAERIE
ncbi:MAG: hypothetical protein ACOCV2_10350 [Persicimonas sp.]